MSLTSESMTPADIAAVTGNNNAWGGEGGWFWIVILFLFAWGRGGYGFGGNGGVQDNYVLTSDFAQVERKLDGLANGLCDGFYAQAQLVNGTNMQMANGFAQAELSRANQQAALVQQLFGIQTAQQQCCCEQRGAIAGVNYNMATQAAATQRVIENGTRDIIENQNGNARAILDALTAQRIEAKDDKIAEQAQIISGLQLAASQAAQNQYLINQLRPAPVPAFPVSAPYQFGGCGTGCGCQ